MAKRKPLTKQQKRSQVKILKRKGLYSGDLRKPVTKYATSLLKKFAGVIAGKERVVSIPNRKAAKQLKEEGYVTKGKKVIVSSPMAGETIVYDKKIKAIKRTTKVNGVRVVRKSLTGREVGGRYTLITGGHADYTIGNKEDLKRFLDAYARKSPNIKSFIFWDEGVDDMEELEGQEYEGDIERGYYEKDTTEKKKSKKKNNKRKSLVKVVKKKPRRKKVKL